MNLNFCRRRRRRCRDRHIFSKSNRKIKKQRMSATKSQSIKVPSVWANSDVDVVTEMIGGMKVYFNKTPVHGALCHVAGYERFDSHIYQTSVS